MIKRRIGTIQSFRPGYRGFMQQKAPYGKPTPGFQEPMPIGRSRIGRNKTPQPRFVTRALRDRRFCPNPGRADNAIPRAKQGGAIMATVPTPEPTPTPSPPPFPDPRPVREPDPDRLPDEEPTPNPDENDAPPKQVGSARSSASLRL
jgi:hypothetical protein